ncbi:MAG: hypothetical protein U9R79_17550 [Armatimonadota bacterium]|nr:hypothetical protein [Armatimonadota bacterium]
MPDAASGTPNRCSGLARAWRRSCSLRATVYALLAVALLVVAPWWYLLHQSRAMLQEELQRIEDAGEPMTLTEAAPKPVPADENAADLYQQVFNVSFTSSYGATSDLDATGYSETIEDEYLAGNVSEEFVREVFEDPAVQQALETLRRASKRPHCVFPIDWSQGAAILFPHLSKMRQAARWLSARSKYAAASGNIDEALDWCRVSLRISEHAAQEPTLIAQLVAIAMQAIAAAQARETLDEGMPSPDVARQMISYLRTIDRGSEFRRAMLGERAIMLDTYQQVREEPQDLATWFGETDAMTWAARLYASPVGLPLFNADQTAYLRLMREQLELLDTVPPSDGLYERLDDLGESVPSTALIARMMFPVFARSAQKRDAAIAELDVFEVALALKVYRQEHGEYPANISQLQAAVDYDLPPEVFTGKPLHYRRDGDGFVVWSLGKDLDDDGGHGPREPGYDWDDHDIVWKVTR